MRLRTHMRLNTARTNSVHLKASFVNLNILRFRCSAVRGAYFLASEAFTRGSNFPPKTTFEVRHSIILFLIGDRDRAIYKYPFDEFT